MLSAEKSEPPSVVCILGMTTMSHLNYELGRHVVKGAVDAINLRGLNNVS